MRSINVRSFGSSSSSKTGAVIDVDAIVASVHGLNVYQAKRGDRTRAQAGV
jgi:hypothetical protein